MGLFRGAVFRHSGGAQKQPIKQPTEMPTSTMALMGRFLSLMGRFPTLMGRFPNFVLWGRFASENLLENSPSRKGALRGSWIPLYQKKLHAQKNDLGINFQKCVMTFRVIDYTKKCLEN